MKRVIDDRFYLALVGFTLLVDSKALLAFMRQLR